MFDDTSVDILRRWIVPEIGENTFREHILPCMLDDGYDIDQIIISRAFNEVGAPSSDVLDTNKDGTSCLGKFVSRFIIGDVSDQYVGFVIKLILFMDKAKQGLFLTMLLRKITVRQIVDLVGGLPPCDATFVCLADVLDRDVAFLDVFGYLLGHMEIMKHETKCAVRRGLRMALKKNVCSSHLNLLISIVFRCSYEAIDMFFVALNDDYISLSIYVMNSTHEDLPIAAPSIPILPVSFLKFLLFTNRECALAFGHIWSYVATAPLLMFELLDRYPEDLLPETWNFLMLRSVGTPKGSPSEYIRIDVLMAFAYALVQHQCLRDRLVEWHIHDVIADFIMSRNDGTRLTTRDIAFLFVYFLICRIHEDSAVQLVIRIDLDGFFATIFDNFLRDYDMLVDFGLWLLCPSESFPFPGTVVIESVRDVLLHFPEPSYTFSKVIVAKMMSHMIRVGVMYHATSNSFEKLLQFAQAKINSNSNAVLWGLADVDVLRSLLTLVGRDDVQRLIVSLLSISCHFPTFSVLYARYGRDVKHLMEFFVELAKNAPLVDDFLHVDRPYSVKCPVVSGTTAMWARFYRNTTVFFTISSASGGMVSLVKHGDKLLVKHDCKIIREFTVDDAIDGWSHVCVRLTNPAMIAVNLKEKAIDVNLTPPLSVTVGSGGSVFDLQSIRTFRELSMGDVTRLFTLGPNFKDLVDADFMSLHESEPTFVSGYEHISSFYFNHISLLDERPVTENNIFKRGNPPVFSISPPFTKAVSMRVSQKGDETEAMLNKRWHFAAFLNSLYCYGGLELLIHNFAEGVTKGHEVHERIFELLEILLNKFPCMHHIFMRRSVYKALASRLWTNSVNPDCISRCALVMRENGCLISNIHAVNEWLLGPSLFHNQVTSVVTDVVKALRGDYAEHNMHAFESAGTYQLIINSISNSAQHSGEFVSLLQLVASMMTHDHNAQKNVEYIMKLLIAYHFNNQQANAKSTDALIRLLEGLLTLHTNVKVNISLLLPMLLRSSDIVQYSLYELVMKHIPEGNLSKLDLVIKAMEVSHESAERIWKISYSLLMQSAAHRYYCISSTMLFLSSHKEGHLLASFCVEAVKWISTMVNTSGLLVHMTEVFNEIGFEKWSVGLESSDEDNNGLVAVIDFCLGVFSHVFAKQHAQEVVRFFEDLVSRESGSFVVYMLGRALTVIIKDDLQEYAVSRFCVWCFAFAVNVFECFCSDSHDGFVLFAKSAFEVAVEIDTSDIWEELFDMLDKVPGASPIAAELLLIAVESNFSVPAIRCAEIRKRLTTTKPPRFGVKEEPENEPATNLKMRTQAELLTLYCNGIHCQTELLGGEYMSGDSNDAMIELWTDVFTVLHFPASLVFDSCPTKYRVEDRTMKVETRRLMFPINPAIEEALYIRNWCAKYGNTPEPKVRLTLNSVIKVTPCIRGEDVRFACDALRIRGTSLLKGVFVLTRDNLKFYEENELMIVPYKEIGSIRLGTFQHQPTGISIVHVSKRVSLFGFEAVSQLTGILEVLLSVVDVEFSIDYGRVKELTNKWCQGCLSNFDYLIHLNFISGRTWCDFTRLPIFPWTILDYSGDTPESGLRDLRYPFFAQTPEQKQACRNYFNVRTIDQQPHHFGNYVSNVGSALYYMIRVEPCTSEEIDFQGGSLDGADRTFQSFEITSNIMRHPNSRNALELIPEAYFFPEFLMNVNDIAFPASRVFHNDIDNVVLTKWGRTPHEFVREMRRVLESDAVSRNLHEWIDLIWGKRRDGEFAAERLNVLLPIIFKFDPKKYVHDVKLLDAFLNQIHNCGQAPLQLFMDFHPEKKEMSVKKRVYVVARKEKRHKRVVADVAHGYRLLANSARVKISDSSIEIRSADSKQEFYGFSNEIVPTMLYCSGDHFVTAHVLPIMNHWTVENGRLVHLRSLRGNLTTISSIVFEADWGVAIAGHVDGKMSVFSTNPHRFLRVVDCGEMPVVMLRIAGRNAEIIALQNNGGCETTVILFSINGLPLARMTLSVSPRDCVVTAFDDGISNDHMFLLTNEHTIVVISVHSLHIKQTISVDPFVSLSLWRNVLFGQTTDGKLVPFDIIDQRKECNRGDGLASGSARR